MIVSLIMFFLKKSQQLWKFANENHGGKKDVENEKYHVIIDKLINFQENNL